MNYTLIYSNAKNLRIEIKRDGSLVAYAPRGMSRREVETFINEKSGWIEKHRVPVRKETPPLEKIFYLGREYPVIYGGDAFRFDGAAFHIPNGLSPDSQVEGIKELYRRLAKPYMADKLRSAADVMRLPRPADPKITGAKTRWGSCGGKNKNSICFSLLLIAAPEACIDYVTVHELAHTVYFNHGDDFWALVEKYVPDRKQLKKLLEEYGKKLTAQGFYN
ncbi:MAG: M48 family metallopeptidase [Clostridia bacterium]|nr:M48 family metallopeptidase [Clostridia bacterium]